MIKLRDYQEQGANDIRQSFRTNDVVLYVLSTGGGKTYLFSYISHSAAMKGRTVFIIVHRKELLLQASKSLRNLGIDHGLISPHFTPAPHKSVQVASIDTLKGRLKRGQVKNVDLLIFDEGHHVTEGNKWGSIYEQLGKPKTLLVTATPVRADGSGLGKGHGGIADEMVLGPPISELIARGMLINPTVYTSLDQPDLTGIKKNKDGDYNTAELAERVDKPVITGSAVAHYKKLCPGSRAIVFCASVKHAQHVVDEFNQAGYRFGLLVGEPNMSDKERSEVVAGLASGAYDGAATCDLVSEGFDVPDLQCCIMLRPTASESLYLQQVGRVMRPSEGKTVCYLLDHVGNVGRHVGGKFVRKHGLPSDHREWTLEGRKKKTKGAKEEPTVQVKQCPKCYHVFEPAAICPKCGHDMSPAERKLEEIEGELQRVTAEMESQIAIKKREKIKQVAAARSLEDLKKIEQERGYKPGWAKRVHDSRQRPTA